MLEQVLIPKFTDIEFQLVCRLERPEEAIFDADKALEFNPYCTKAIVEKGEALYKMGQFENALVQFHRGLRLRGDPDIKLGCCCKLAFSHADVTALKLITKDNTSTAHMFM